MLKKISLMVAFSLLLTVAPAVAEGKMLVTQLSSGADGLVRFEVSSDATAAAPAAGNDYVLVVRADGASAQDFVPLDSVNFVNCSGGGCLTLGLGLTDSAGQPLFFGGPMAPKQPLEIAIQTGELCRTGSLQAGGKPSGCTVDPTGATGFAQTGSVNLQFSVYILGQDASTPPEGKSLDQSNKLPLAPAP